MPTKQHFELVRDGTQACSVAKMHCTMQLRLLVNNKRPDLCTHSLVSIPKNIILFLIL